MKKSNTIPSKIMDEVVEYLNKKRMKKSKPKKIKPVYGYAVVDRDDGEFFVSMTARRYAICETKEKVKELWANYYGSKIIRVKITPL